jgi:hypothetical protein
MMRGTGRAFSARRMTNRQVVTAAPRGHVIHRVLRRPDRRASGEVRYKLGLRARL